MFLAGCSIGFDTNMLSDMHDVNTQVAEQCNAALRKQRAILAYMRVDNFMNHVRFSLWFHNIRISLKYFPDHTSVVRFKALTYVIGRH